MKAARWVEGLVEVQHDMAVHRQRRVKGSGPRRRRLKVAVGAVGEQHEQAAAVAFQQELQPPGHAVDLEDRIPGRLVRLRATVVVFQAHGRRRLPWLENRALIHQRRSGS